MMLIFIIDDEPAMLASAERAVRAAAPAAEILTFRRAQTALDAITQENRKPDVVFTDIRMPGLSGLDLAVRVRGACPSAKIVFVTGYDEYALDAFRIHAHGYILKPLDPERVKEELDALASDAASPDSRPAAGEGLYVRCFGYFEVFWNGSPLKFGRQQTKELLAYLVNREGDACTTGQIADTLWEDEVDEKALKNRVRVLIGDLRSTFKGIGMEHLLIRRSGWIAVNRALLDCDFYRLLDGDMREVNNFDGSFMQQYSWAELTAGRLYYHYHDE